MPEIPAGIPVLEMHGVRTRHQGLRPLRISALRVAAGERVSVGGLDAGVGELLINLVTGAALPETGEVRILGRPTAEIASGDDWLASLDRFGIVSPRAVLLEGATLEQNLAMPFTLDIDPVPAEVAARVRQLAARCGIDAGRWLGRLAGELPADVRMRARLARAVALDPLLVILEHPTADVAAGDRRALAADMARACSAGTLAAVVLTNDDEFGRGVAPRNLRLEAATGELKPLRRGWFGRV